MCIFEGESVVGIRLERMAMSEDASDVSTLIDIQSVVPSSLSLALEFAYLAILLQKYMNNA